MSDRESLEFVAEFLRIMQKPKSLSCPLCCRFTPVGLRWPPVFPAFPEAYIPHLLSTRRDLVAEFQSAAHSCSDITDSMPVWDRQRRELRVCDALIKRFRVPAPNQELILGAFQEEQWPPRIDDPIPQTTEIEPKQRLRDTIRALNKNQQIAGILRFTGDGTGEGILWQAVPFRRLD